MTPTRDYKKWLEAVCSYYDLSEEIIISRIKGSEYISDARRMFYWLCLNDNIDVYRLSELLGKHRSTIMSTMKKYPVPDFETLNKIKEDVNTRAVKAEV